MPLDAAATTELAALVGPGGLLGAAELAARDPGVDPRNFGAGLLVRPASTAEVVRLLAYCHERRIGVVPHGGRSGLSGGAESRPGELIVSLERLDAIEAFDPVSRTVVAGAGVRLGTLAALAATRGLSPGIDLAARDSATLGGLVSTNAGGLAAFRYGTMRDRVLGLEAVLADGTVIGEAARVRKRNEGLALEQLFIGAEGTLGVVTRVALELVAEAGWAATALVTVADLAAAVEVCDALQSSSAFAAAAFELMSGNHAAANARQPGFAEFAGLARAPWLLLLEVTAAAAAVAEGGLVEALALLTERGVVAEAMLAQNDAQRRSMWRLREDWQIDRERPGALWYDVSVPLAEVPGYLRALEQRIAAHDPSLGLAVIGHLADGNLHVTVNASTPLTARYEEVAPLVTEGLAAVGGSFSAEHGIGLEKKATLARLGSPAKLRLMRGVKALFDPRGIMNPAKVIPD